MVKGISRQVIVVQGADPRLFEQAIFILKDEAVREGITDEALLKEARQAIRGSDRPVGKGWFSLHGALWAAAGAMVTGIAWLISVVL